MADRHAAARQGQDERLFFLQMHKPAPETAAGGGSIGVFHSIRQTGQIRSQSPVSSSRRSNSAPLKSKRETIPMILPSSTIGT